MATVLMAWELGGGIGHLMNLRPIGKALVERGHRVIAALREIGGARKAFEGTGITFISAPQANFLRKIYDPMRSMAHVLGNSGFGDEGILATLLESWNAIFDIVKPEVVIADHAPNALLALYSREGNSREIARVNVGLGFFCPPAGFPLPYWL